MSTPHPLSASINGRPILAAAAASPGTLVHAVPLAGHIDRVTLVVTNITAGATDVDVEFGGTAASDRLVVNVPARSSMTIVDDVPLLAGEVRVFDAAGGAFVVTGKVVRE